MKRSNFIDNGSDDGSYSDSDEDYYHSDKILKCNEKKYLKIKKEIKDRYISINDVLSLDLPIDEYIWFIEHINMLKELEYNSIERYELKTEIYTRYNNIKNIDGSLIKKMKNFGERNNDNMIKKIMSSHHSDEIKILLYNKFKRNFENSKNDSDESFKIVEWVETVLHLPTQIHRHDNCDIDKYLKKLWNSLNKNISGLGHVKENIMETMCSKLLHPESGGKVLLLSGPPGVGKTSIAKLISESLDMPFDQLSFGSITDSSTLTGNSSTYIGSQPGLFTKILLKSGRLDTVVLLDELDKIICTPEGNSISSTLLHVLDRSQNSRFRDMYIPEIPIDLSKILFIAAANPDEENGILNIDNVLLDRVTTINISGYTLEEQTNISLEHIFPRIKKELQFKEDELTISKESMKYLIEKKTVKQVGMRDIERNIYKLCV